MKKLLLTLALLFTPSITLAANITVPQSTAYGQVLIGNASGGNYDLENLEITDHRTAGSPYTISSTGGSGGSGGGTWATTTSTVLGELINYSLNNTDIVTVGGNSTSSAKFIFDPNSQIGYFSSLVGIGTKSPSASLSITGSGVTNPFLIASSSGNTMLTVLANGNVGIGTTNPQAKLDILGTASTTNLFVNASTTLQNFTFLAATGTSATTTNFFTSNESILNSIITNLIATNATTTYATSTNLYTSGQTILAATNGKVGIGTSSPTNLLDIAAGGNGNISLFVHGTSVQSSLSPQVLHLNDSYGSNNSGQSIDGTSGSLTFTTASNSIIFKPGGSEAARITSSGDLAIGTTSPYAEVAVAALPANYNANILTVSSSTAAFATTTLLNFNSNGQLLLQSTDSTATHLLSIGGSGSFWVRNDGAITASKISTGHIVINNYDHVIQSTDNSSLILGGSSLNPSTNGPTLYLNANKGSSDYSAFLDNGIEMMRITNNGNVGIGSSTPWGLLTVASSTLSGVPMTEPMFVVGTSTLSLGATTTDFIVDQNGNVGVHTSTPTSALYVVGTLTVQAPGINGATIKSGYNQGNGELDLAANGASPVILRTNGEVDITSAPYLAKSNSLSVAGNIYTAANLGIGTTSPFTNLSIAGSAYIGGNLTATGTVLFTDGTTTIQNGNLMIGTTANGGNIFSTSTPLQISTSTNNYVQALIYNGNSGSDASADFVVANNQSTNGATYFGDLGSYRTAGNVITTILSGFECLCNSPLTMQKCRANSKKFG